MKITIPSLLFFLFFNANANYDLPPSEIRSRLVDLSHKPWNKRITQTNPVNVKNCLISKIQIQVSSRINEIWQFEFVFARPNINKNVPLVLLIPTIERTTPLESTLIYQFCKTGVAVALIDSNDNSHPNPLPSWDHEDKVLRQTVITIKTVLDWANSVENIDSKRISLYGHSLGGITAALMAGVENKRFNSIIVAVGAGNIPGVMTQSIYFRVASLKFKRMAATRMTTLNEYESKLRQNIRFDPLYFSSRVNPRKMYFVMASGDLSVPFRYQLETHQAFGSPQYHLFSPGSHVDGMIRLATLDFQKVLPIVTQLRE